MPTMKELREAGVASALAPIAARLDALKPAFCEAAETEELAMKIAGMSGERLAPVMKEVERRAEVFAQAQASSARVYGSPKKRALQSVLDDLVTGRFA